MDPARWQTVKSLLDRALDLSPPERPGFLDEVCGDDVEMRREIDELLAADASSAERLEPPVQGVLSSLGLARPHELGTRIGGYRLVRVIASGGMGTVYEAEQEQPRRRVALKVMRHGFHTSEDASRFRYESEVLGRLQHPGIAQVYESGTHVEASEVPYFAMEFVQDARTITEYAREHGLTIDQRLLLFVQVCEAAHHGHQKGVIHRDLKPGNILVGAQGAVKIIDFGVARAGGADVIQRTMRTEAGEIVGTLHYMSPEQLAGEIDEIDIRADVYALGVVLYELLCGRLPHDLAKKSIVAAARIVAEETPLAPSRLDPALSGDLEWILVRAMEKDRERRYASALELAQDIRRHLACEPVLAGPPSRAYRLRKFVRRHAIGVAAAAAVFLALVLGVTGTSLGLFRAVRAEELASQKKAEAESHLAVSEEEKRKVLRLSDGKRLKVLVQEAAHLWPAQPDRIADIEAWLGRASELASRLSKHRDALEELRGRAIAPPQQEAGSASSAWTFASTEEEWQHDVLGELVTDLGAFVDPEKGAIHDVEQRLTFARTVDERTRTGPEARRLWTEAIASIRDRARCPRYDGLEITPQLGLLPFGRDPDSGLWEFAHVATGAVPERFADGEIEVTEESALVLVLIPGGTFWMGAQKDDPAAPNYDAEATRYEYPANQVTLAPFFLSKYEMTQAQWMRFAKKNPSWFQPGANLQDEEHPFLHPVEQVSWEECDEALRGLDLALPTEAQWEYAARAWTTTRWWTGAEKESLEGACNIADRHCKEASGALGRTYEEWLDDGWLEHARIGMFRANGFGLHDVCGNVAEWCLDAMDSYTTPARAGDGMRHGGPLGDRVVRGGCFAEAAFAARSSSRESATRDYKLDNVGVRPARAVD